MSEAVHPPIREQKSELESRAFKDGAIYLFRRADYKKPTWFCRVRVPNGKGYVQASTKPRTSIKLLPLPTTFSTRRPFV